MKSHRSDERRKLSPNNKFYMFLSPFFAVFTAARFVGIDFLRALAVLGREKAEQKVGNLFSSPRSVCDKEFLFSRLFTSEDENVV